MQEARRKEKEMCACKHLVSYSAGHLQLTNKFTGRNLILIGQFLHDNNGKSHINNLILKYFFLRYLNFFKKLDRQRQLNENN